MAGRSNGVDRCRDAEAKNWGKWLALVVVLALGAGSGESARRGKNDSPNSRVKAGAQAGPPAGMVSTKVLVPASMSYSPFNVDRYLNVPPGFSASVFARVGGARFIAVAPSGDLLVSQPGAGKVMLVRANLTGDPTLHDFATGLRSPHDIVFHTIGATTYVYVSESTQIDRYIYYPGDTAAHDRQVVVAGLPDASTPELHGSYSHPLKNIAIDSNDKLYVSIGSSCNVCSSDGVANPVRAAVYQYNADGSGARLFATGLRNAEGIRLVPGTTDLWAVINHRDNIAYPADDGTGKYGQVIPAFVDNHPPDEFTRVRDGGNFGWPYCNPNPDTSAGLDSMPFDRDYQMNRDGHVDCSSMNRIDKGIQAHSAPLGLLFLQDTNFGAVYRSGAIVCLHGSWNRTAKTGYKVAYFPWDTAGQGPGDQMDFITGWLDDATQQVWGRPVSAAVDQQGNLYISDDASGTIYKLTGSPGTGLAPVISAASVDRKNLLVTGQYFDAGSVVLVNGADWRTLHDDQNPGILVAKKAAKQISSGQRVLLQVRNSNGMLSSDFAFTKP
jgi:glucose/arabinose dehydrogenase